MPTTSVEADDWQQWDLQSLPNLRPVFAEVSLGHEAPLRIRNDPILQTLHVLLDLGIDLLAPRRQSGLALEEVFYCLVAEVTCVVDRRLTVDTDSQHDNRDEVMRLV